MNPRYPLVALRAGFRYEYCHAPQAAFNFEMGEVRLIPGMPREIAQTMTGWDPIDGLV
jgi:hypothetical protein